mmetsp:Transcript_25800/g.50512  ORF Transcript_25800/g.50512 Transcript_25800/m.50512 type:complete len:117 (-) Transcript_25800:578-928(-)
MQKGESLGEKSEGALHAILLCTIPPSDCRPLRDSKETEGETLFFSDSHQTQKKGEDEDKCLIGGMEKKKPKRGGGRCTKQPCRIVSEFSRVSRRQSEVIKRGKERGGSTHSQSVAL